MYLPPGYADPQEYFQQSCQCLAKYEWIYNFQLTHFFLAKPWESIPAEWVEFLLALTTEEINQLPYDIVKEHWPPTFKDFVSMTTSLSLPRQQNQKVSPVTVAKELARGMNPKKRHEVAFMAEEVGAICRKRSCDLVVDVGAGLGYLGQVLHKEFSLPVIGLESQMSRTHGAETRVEKQHLPGAAIRSVTLEIQDTVECEKLFEETIQHEWRELCRTKPQSEQHHTRSHRNPDRPLQKDDNLLKYREHYSDLGPACQGHSNNLDRDAEGQAHSDDLGRDTECQGHSDDLGKDTECQGHSDNLGRHAEGQGIISDGEDHSKDFSRGDERCNENIQIPPQEVVKCSTSCSEGGTRKPRICMVGLHCCGDLTPTMLKFFSRCENIGAIVCVSCCYHRLETSDTGTYNSFPMSETLQQAYKDYLEVHGSWRMNTFALRLAAQETRARWKGQTEADHEFHLKHVAYRGLLQVFLESEQSPNSRRFRKVAKKEHFVDFKTYVSAVLERMEFQDREVADQDAVRQRLDSIYQEHSQYFKFIEIFTLLQVLVQPVLESLILLDRQTFLRERPRLQTDLQPLFDEYISPRNMALIAWK